MAEKTKINDYGDCIYTEQDALDLLYTNPDFDISKLFFDLGGALGGHVRSSWRYVMLFSAIWAASCNNLATRWDARAPR